MNAVGCQQRENDEIRDQQRKIKPVNLVESFESCIEKVLADVLR